MYELLAAGKIESVHVGQLHKVPVRALDAYVARLTAEVVGSPSGRTAPG